MAALYTMAYFPSHHFLAARCSEPPSILSYDVQSCPSQFWRSEPPSLLSFGVQSHHLFLVSAFKATISSQFGHLEPPSLFHFRRSEPPFTFQFGRSKPPSLLSLVFRATMFSVWCLEPPSFLSFGIQSHHLLVTAFRATIS